MRIKILGIGKKDSRKGDTKFIGATGELSYEYSKGNGIYYGRVIIDREIQETRFPYLPPRFEFIFYQVKIQRLD